MSIFSAVGDFFRSPFEDDQEKKRRKLREQQEAQQRAAQKAAPKPQNRPAPNQTGLPVDNWFSMAKPSPQVPAAIASPAPLTAQTSLPKPNTPPTPATSPQPTQTPQAPQEEYLGGKLGEGKNKTIFGWNAAALLPKSLEKLHEVKANKPVKLSSQQFLEQFDKIDDSGGLKRAYVADLQKQAKENPLAAKTLKLLQDNGRMQGGVTEFVRGSNEKLYGGLLRGAARGADMLLPGHNTFGLERFADDQEGQKEFTKQGKRGETAGSVQKGIVDVATIAIPGSKVDKLAEETALARRLAEGGGFARTLGKAGSILPGSLFGTGVDYLQTKGRGDDANLGKSAATGTAIDVGLGLIPGGLGRVLKRIKGEETIEDAAKPLEDDLIEALDDDVVERLKGATTEQEASQILEEAKTTKGEIPKPPTPLDEQAVKAVEDLRTETKAEIERIEKSTLAPQQKTAQKEAVMEKLKKTTEQLEANVAKSAANVDAVGAKTVQERAKIAVEDLRAETKAEMDRIDSSIATPEQKAVRKEAVMERLKKASDEIQANVAKSAVAEQAARQDVVEEVQDAQKGAVEPGAKPVDGTEAADLIARKKALEDVVNRSEALKKQGAEAVAKQADQLDEAVKTGEEAVADARAAQAAPTAEQVIQDTPVAGSPEVKANDGYAPDVNAYTDTNYTEGADRLMDDLMSKMGYDLTRKERKNLWSQLLGVAPRAQQAVTHRLSDAVNTGLTAASKSENGLTSGLAQAPRSIWSRFGMGDKARASLDSLGGLYNTATEVGLKISRRRNATIDDLIKNGYSKEQLTQTLHQVFETPEFLARKYGDQVQKLSPDQLPPELKKIVDEQIELNKIRNRLNFETGVIDEPTYFQGQDGMHTPRVYGFDFSKANNGRKGFSSFDSTAGISRNELADVPDDIFNTVVDPLTAQDIRFQQALINKSRMDAIHNIKAQFGAFDTPPNKGYTKLIGKQFGELDGKWVDNQVVATIQGSPVFKTKAGESLNSLLDTYRNSPLGTIDRAIKQTKTVGSVGTQIGNVGSNVTLFSTGAGVDPAHALFRGLGGARSLIADAKGTLDPDIYFLRKAGIIGSDTGRAINGISQKDLIRIESALTDAEALSKKNPGKAMKLFNDAWGKLQDVYGGTDDAFKIGIFRELKARGMSDDSALRIIREQFQNYDNVGHGVQMAADSPILGKPFARFVPELARISKNSVKNNPIGVGAGLVGIKVAGDKLSEAAGESPEDRARRENALGQTKLPGNISLNLPVGDSSVNIARSVGLNFPMDTDGSPSTAVVNQMTPVAIPVREDKGGNKVFAPEEAVTSMALNPIARMIANRDFMGRRVTDPDNAVRWEGNGQTRFKYENPDGTPMDKDNGWANRARAAAMSYLPFSSEVDAGIAAARGKEDYYGKERSVPQAIGRMFGVKVESNNGEARQKRAEQEQYYGDKLPQIQKFLKENPDLTNAYWKLKNTARDRNTEVSQNDLVSPERYKVITGDKSGRLFNFLKQQAIKTAEEKGEPVDPIYTLPQNEANQVLQLKSMYTGDDTKFQQLLYKQPWFNAYKEAERAYYAQKGERETFEGAPKQNERPERWYALSDQLNGDNGVKAQFPLVKQYNDAIAQFADYDSQERKNFTKNWYARLGDTYNQQKEAYEAARLDIVNQMREIEGAPPLSMEIWRGKFETEDDSSGGGGFGFGFGGGGNNDWGKLGEISNTSIMDRLDAPEVAQLPALAKLLASAQGRRGGGRAKPKLGAASRGTG